jgi:hypothetical protein
MEVEIILISKLTYGVGYTVRVEAHKMMIVFIFAGLDTVGKTLEYLFHVRLDLNVTAKEPDYVVSVAESLTNVLSVLKAGLIAFEQSGFGITVFVIPHGNERHIKAVFFGAVKDKINVSPPGFFAFVVIVELIEGRLQAGTSILIPVLIIFST